MDFNRECSSEIDARISESRQPMMHDRQKSAAKNRPTDMSDDGSMLADTVSLAVGIDFTVDGKVFQTSRFTDWNACRPKWVPV